MKETTGKEVRADRREIAPASNGNAPGVQMREVRGGEAGQRIDNFLFTALKGVPKSLVYRILRTGEVRVNKRRVKPLYRLQAGDVLRIPPLRLAEPDAPRTIPIRRLDELRAAVLHEDADLLVLDKPSGWAVHGGSGVSYGIIEALRESRTDLPDLELVHRLDRETSGCLLLAKNRSTLLALHAMLRRGDIEKRYLAVVQGQWPAKLRRVDAALQKNLLQSGERMVASGDEGKDSITEFSVRAHYKGASLVEARLLTGRTHQVRVHAAHVGHPLAGDPKYGNADFNKYMKKQGLQRLFLHAQALRFQLPGSARLNLRAPLPPELQQVLDSMEAVV